MARAVEDALADSQAAYRARGILVATDLQRESGLRADDLVVYRAVYTLFRGLPARLVEGSALLVRSHARAGGDVELVWETAEDPQGLPVGPRATPAEALSTGPFGDLFAIALLALEQMCRSRGGLAERVDEPPVSSAILRGRVVRRRYLFLIPGSERAAYPAP